MIAIWALVVVLGIPLGTVLGYVIGGNLVTRMAHNRLAFEDVYRASRVGSYVVALPAVIVAIYVGAGLGFWLASLTGPNLFVAIASGAIGVALVLALGLLIGLVGGAQINIRRARGKAQPS